MLYIKLKYKVTIIPNTYYIKKINKYSMYVNLKIHTTHGVVKFESRFDNSKFQIAQHNVVCENTKPQTAP